MWNINFFYTYTANTHSYILHFAYFTWTKLFNHLFWSHLITFSIVFMLCKCIVFMQATSQSLVTQLTKLKVFCDATKLTHQKLISRSTTKNEDSAYWTQFSAESSYNYILSKSAMTFTFLASQIRRL